MKAAVTEQLDRSAKKIKPDEINRFHPAFSG